jgi:hypothetical protein
MTTKISIAAAIAAANAMTALVDAGSGAGILKIYDGAMPATVDTALGAQQLLAEFPLDAVDAFQDAVDTVGGAVATANAVAAQDGLITGTATWGWVTDSDDNPVFMGDVSNPAGTGAIKISSTAITAGIEISVISLSYTQPKA